MKITQSGPTLCDTMDYTDHGILQARILECSLSLLLEIFPTQRSNPGLLHCRQILYQLNHKGSPRILEWVCLSLLQGNLLNPGIEPGSPALQVDSLPTELSGKPIVIISTLKSLSADSKIWVILVLISIDCLSS